MQQPVSLGRRSLTSGVWRVGSSLGTVAVLALRSILLARWLPVETFGVYVFATAVVGLTSNLASFGLTSAFLHRSPETENEEAAAAIHFTLTALLTLVWGGVTALVICGLAEGELRLALLVLVATTVCVRLAQTPRAILIRRVLHRRMAVLQLLTAVGTTLVALGLASRGFALGALLATDVTIAVLTLVTFYLWRPVWRPRFGWSARVARYFLGYGGRSWLADTLQTALDRTADLWTGAFLGKIPLGFFSRAFVFATYPRRILAAPIGAVSVGTFAELKNDRRQLSRAFVRINAVLVRSGFFLAGLLALLANDIVYLLIGAKWAPMLTAFRFLLVFALLDPINSTVTQLFVAIGYPQTVARTRALQLVILVVSLFLLLSSFGITGAALAVDIMLLSGATILFRRARVHVDFSLVRLLVAPGLALALAWGSASGLAMSMSLVEASWRSAVVKIGIFTAVYGGVLLGIERQSALELLRFALRSFPRLEDVAAAAGLGRWWRRLAE